MIWGHEREAERMGVGGGEVDEPGGFEHHLEPKPANVEVPTLDALFSHYDRVQVLDVHVCGHLSRPPSAIHEHQILPLDVPVCPRCCVSARRRPFPTEVRRPALTYTSTRSAAIRSMSNSTPRPGPVGTTISPFSGSIGFVTISVANVPHRPTAKGPSINGPGHAPHMWAAAAVATLVLG